MTTTIVCLCGVCGDDDGGDNDGVRGRVKIDLEIVI